MNCSDGKSMSKTGPISTLQPRVNRPIEGVVAQRHGLQSREILGSPPLVAPTLQREIRPVEVARVQFRRADTQRPQRGKLYG